MHVLIKAAMRGVQFNVIVTESLPHHTGATVKKILEENHIPVKLICDSVVGVAI